MFSLLFLVLAAGCSGPTPPSDSGVEDVAATTARAAPAGVTYTNAYWFGRRGEQVGFTKGDKHVVGDRFVAGPSPDATVVDLEGLYVVPPYGEAHNHSVDGPGTDKAAARYVEQGIFYYKNPNGIAGYTQPMLAEWDKPDTLDVSLAYGGLSVDEGHPETLYKTLIGYGLYANYDAEKLDGEAFFDVGTIELLDAKWPTILANNPDFLKLYLLEHDTPDSDGLSEGVFREIVRRAKAAGLTTTVHVETVQDLALVVDAGADEAAHLPAYNLRIAKDEGLATIPDDLVRKMADTGTVVITTTNVSQGRDYAADDLALVMQRQADNLKRMHAAGVPIAIGSDTFFQTAWDEVKTLRALEAFNDAELLTLWVETPALSIFPNRKIGVLAPGYEASFLALACNPLQDIECSQQIQLGIKQGITLIDAAARELAESP